MEIVGHLTTVIGDHIDLVSNKFGNLAGHLNNQRVLSDETGVQDGLLIIEVHLLDAVQVFTNQTNDCLGICLNK